MNFPTFIALAIVVAIVYFAIHSMRKKKKDSGSGCVGCPSAGQCHNFHKE